jgi:hypothetical protein
MYNFHQIYPFQSFGFWNIVAWPWPLWSWLSLRQWSVGGWNYRGWGYSFWGEVTLWLWILRAHNLTSSLSELKELLAQKASTHQWTILITGNDHLIIVRFCQWKLQLIILSFNSAVAVLQNQDSHKCTSVRQTNHQGNLPVTGNDRFYQSKLQLIILFFFFISRDHSPMPHGNMIEETDVLEFSESASGAPVTSSPNNLSQSQPTLRGQYCGVAQADFTVHLGWPFPRIGFRVPRATAGHYTIMCMSERNKVSCTSDVGLLTRSPQYKENN